MFPIRDENPTIQPTLITMTLIGINAAVWVFVQGMGFDPSLSRSVCEWGLISGNVLGKIPGGTHIPLSRELMCVIAGDPRYETLVSHMFMHGSWFHIISNMWFLWVFGDNVEDSMGRVRFIVFYLLCGFAAAASQILVNPNSIVPMVGASGAIGGVMGAYAVLYPKSPVHMLVIFGFFIDRIVVPAYFMLGYWFILQLLSGLPTIGGESGGVAFFAHIGGFLAGIVLSFIFKDRKRVAYHQAHYERRW